MNELVAYLPGASPMEISMTSGQFNADMFAMANARNFHKAGSEEADETYYMYHTETLTPDATAHTVVLTYPAVADTIVINGLEQAQAAAEGKFAAATADGKTTLTFDASETGAMEITYQYEVNDAQIINVDNKSAAIGEVIMKWPVYAAGDDCTESAIKGYVTLRIYRCRVTAMPGFDTSYKSAA